MHRKGSGLAPLALLMGLIFLTVSGQPLAAAGDFPINSHTPGDQLEAKVAAAADGGFVVVWTSVGQDGDAEGVFARQFSAAGLPAGPEIQVDTQTAGDQSEPAVAVDSAGNFVVAWSSERSGLRAVLARRFSSDGTPTEAPFEVDSPMSAYSIQTIPAVALADSGDFVVVWHQYPRVLAERFDSSGQPTTAVVEVVSNPNPGAQILQRQDLATALRPDGSFVVVWSTRAYCPGGPPCDAEWVKGAVHDVGGAQAGQFFVSLDSSIYSSQPSLAMDSGGFVVAWASRDLNSSTLLFESKITGHRFAADGSPLGQLFAVTPTDTSQRTAPSLAVFDPGEMLVVWSQDEEDILGRRLDSTGVPLADEFRVNATVAGDDRNPELAAVGDEYVLVWDGDDRDGDGSAIVGRASAALFADGFESGGTDSWSATSAGMQP